MKKILILAITSILFSPFAGAKGLFEGSESKFCFESTPDVPQQNNCLSDASEKSQKKLDRLINITRKRIKVYNLGPFYLKGPITPTIGDVYSKRFMKAQIIWKRYRKELCLAVAGELYEDSWDYSRFMEQCQINLNKRHMEEIEAMGYDTDE